MRIVLDLQGAQTESCYRGIGRYSLSLAMAIVRNAGDHEIKLVLNSAFPESILNIRHVFEGLIPQEHIRVFDVPIPVAERNPANAWRARAAEKIREHFIQQLQPDVVLVASLFEGYYDDAVTSVGAFSTNINTVVILYDLIPFLNPAIYLPTLIWKQYYDRKIQSLKKADLLLAISDYSRQEAIATLGLMQDSVVSISTAADEKFKPQKLVHSVTEMLCHRFGITRKIILYAPGGFDARKNLDGLINAYVLLSSELRASHQLVIVSKINDVCRRNLQQLRKKAGLGEDELVVTGFVSDEDLIALYNLAALFVFPSKYEGFGLPALEAMSCGAPTIGSNNTSITEVIGWDEALFDPSSARSIADKMTQFLKDDHLYDQLRKHGLRQAKRFSWDVIAKRAISAIEFQQSLLSSNNCQSSIAVDRFGYTPLIESLAEINTSLKATDNDLIVVANTIAFNIGNNTTKQLLVDISEIVQRDSKSGIQRVVRSILLELLNKALEGYEVRPIYFDGHQYRYAQKFTSQFIGKSVSRDTDEVVEFNQDDVYLGLDLIANITHVVHPLHMRLQCIGVHIYFVVYDILSVKKPDWWPQGISTVFEEWLISISKVATGLICISGAVADEVRAWLKQNPPSRPAGPVVSSFHLGADVENSLPTNGLPDDASEVLSALAERSSFLMVGTLEPRKGYAQTIDAFEELWAKGVDVNLVIVGKQGWLVDVLVDKLRHQTELGKRFFWLEGISDEYLEKVYAVSTCLITASEGEGFGLPLIEAARHKVPIIARDIPVFREVAGERAFYFSGLEPQKLAEAINNWLTLNAMGKAPQSIKMPWLTWRQSTQQLCQKIFSETGCCS